MTSEEPAPVQLRQALGLWAVTAYGVGDILGAGIYALVGKIAGVAGSAAWMSFLVAMAVAALTALSYAELGARFPRSGGEAYFCQQAFRRPALPLLIGWLVFTSGVVSLATVSRSFAGYLVEPLSEPSPWIHTAALTAFLVAVAGITFWGIRQTSTANIVCTVVEVSGLLIVLVVGMRFVSQAAPAGSPVEIGGAGVAWFAVVQGGALAFFAFIGFEDMVNVAEEVKRPERDLPIAIILAVSVAGCVYILVAWVATRVVPPGELSEAEGPLLEVVRRAAPGFPLWLFTLISLLAVANTGLLNFVMGSRLLYGMAQQGLLPRWLGAVHARTRTPYLAIAAIFVAASVLGIVGTLKGLATTTSFLLLAVFFTMNLSLVVIRLRGPQHNGGFRVPLVLPIGAGSLSLGLMFFVPLESWIAATVIIALGAVIVALRWRRMHGAPGAQVSERLS